MVLLLTHPRPKHLRFAIGARIKNAREGLGKSQEWFAIQMGRSTRKWAYEVESGKTGLSAEDLSAAANVLGVRPEWLLEGTQVDIDIPDPELRLFFRNYDWDEFTNEEKDVIRQGINMALAARRARGQMTPPTHEEIQADLQRRIEERRNPSQTREHAIRETRAEFLTGNEETSGKTLADTSENSEDDRESHSQ